MEILFKQKPGIDGYSRSPLEDFSVDGCIFKYISFEKDRSHITRKRHYHTNFELHIIENGYQVYEIGNEKIRVEKGQFLLIFPLVKHITETEDPETEKYAFSFRLGEESPLLSITPSPYLVGTVPNLFYENLEFIRAERQAAAPYGYLALSLRVFECLLHFLRAVGLTEGSSSPVPYEEKNDRFLLATQYVDDNVYRSVSVSELASYACISAKQLQRIFERETGKTVMEYIWKRRAIKIEELLSNPALSLREISEIMNFNNEYYFNSFFKKISGMTPGAYRKTVIK